MTYTELLARYRAKHGKLIRPVQGWDSLDGSLWLAYSMARVRSFNDLGTFNPASRLPSGRKSDHAYYPSFAFDVGRKGWLGRYGYGYWAAKRLANLYVQHYRALSISYVIVGDRIWTRAQGWHPYTGDRSHYTHVHVSGVH